MIFKKVISLLFFLGGCGIYLSGVDGAGAGSKGKIKQYKKTNNGMRGTCGSVLKGVYSRDLNIKCCKDRNLFSEIDIIHHPKVGSGIHNCYVNSAKNNPDDDLATSMWRMEACKVKQIMGVNSEDINFNKFVTFFTRNYTTENNVQNLIRNASKDCTDGDNEEEFHKKIQAYYNCFYTKEQEICDINYSSGNVTKMKNQYLGVHRLSNSSNENKESPDCKPTPGVWLQEQYCCNGQSTPTQWSTIVTMKSPTFMNLTSGTKKCLKNIQKFTQNNFPKRASSDSTSALYNNNPVKIDEIDFKTRIICLDACTMNPNETEDPTITWDSKNSMKFYLTNTLSEKVKKELFDYMNERKSTLKIRVASLSRNRNQTELTFAEIENNYAASKNKLDKIINYCSYYKGFSKLYTEAVFQYCDPKATLHRGPLGPQL